MTVTETLERLEGLGDAKVRARNRKLGAGEAQYGVRLGDIRKLAKEIGTDHEAALALWETGNLEARLLAILTMRPKRLSGAQLDALVRSARVAQLADWLNAYVVEKHPDRETLRRAWIDDPDPWAARAGWSSTATRVAKDPDGLDLAALLDRIEAELATADPTAQWTMNNV